jgi:hypothetical protein
MMEGGAEGGARRCVSEGGGRSMNESSSYVAAPVGARAVQAMTTEACRRREPSPTPWWLFKTTDGSTRGLCDAGRYVDFYDVGGSAMATALRQIGRAPSDLGAWASATEMADHMPRWRNPWCTPAIDTTSASHAARSLT